MRAIATILVVGRAALAAETAAPGDDGGTRSRAAGVKLEIAAGVPEPRDAEQRRALDHGVADGEESAPEPVPGSRSGQAGGLRGTFGLVHQDGVTDAWFGRLELEGFAGQRFEGAGRTYGVLVGGEYWRADDAAGGGLPASFWLGYRTPVLFTSMGLGFEMFIIDVVHDDSGFGLYAPFATASVGIELAGFRLLADARATYRWQWGADDHAQYQVGLTMSQFLENPAPPIEHPRERRASKATSW